MKRAQRVPVVRERRDREGKHRMEVGVMGDMGQGMLERFTAVVSTGCCGGKAGVNARNGAFKGGRRRDTPDPSKGCDRARRTADLPPISKDTS